MNLQEIESQIKVLHEDNHVLVVLKPRNMPSQADKTGDMDLLTMLKEYLKLKYQKPGNVYLGLVHRLDRPTGGVMVFAKTDKAAARLSEDLKKHEIQKKYLTVVVGTPRQAQGRLTHYLIKDERNNIVKCYVGAETGSKVATLDYKVLDQNEGLALVEIDLITGRSHQARVQMAHIGHPIFADHKYGKLKIGGVPKSPKPIDAPQSENPEGDSPPRPTAPEPLFSQSNVFLQQVERPPVISGYGKPLALWAYQLTFTHPVLRDTRVFKVFPPDDEIPWSLFSLEKHIQVSRPD